MPIEERTLEEKVDKIIADLAIYKAKVDRLEDQIKVLESKEEMPLEGDTPEDIDYNGDKV